MIIYITFLAVSIFILSTILILYYFIYLLKIKEQNFIVQLVLLILVSTGYSILYETIRLFAFLGFIPYEGTFDIIGYYFVIFLTLFSFSLLFKLLLILAKQKGQEIKYGEVIRNVYLIIIIGLFGVNALTYIESSPVEFGYFEFETHPILFYIILIIYLPYLTFMFKTFRGLFKEVNNKRIKRQFVAVRTIFVVILIERLVDLGGSYLFPVTFLRIFIEYSFLFLILIVAVFFILSERDFFENLSSYFCVKSIFFIRKTGQMLFGYQFHEHESQISFSSDELLIGGFIYAISNGLKMSLNIEGEIDEIEIGETTLIIEHGKETFAIFFVSEHTNKLHEKIKTFIKEFETNFKDELENWTGDISQFHSEKTQALIFDIFK